MTETAFFKSMLLGLFLSTSTLISKTWATSTLIHQKNLLTEQEKAQLLKALDNADGNDKSDLENKLQYTLAVKKVYQVEVPLEEDKDDETTPVTSPGPVAGRTEEGDGLLEKVKYLNRLVDEFIVLGEKIIPLVKKGTPVRTLNVDPLRVLPFEDKGDKVLLLKTENWQPPKSQSYRIVWENLYGVDVVDFTFSVGMSYGGSFQGAGKYLAGVYAAPSVLDLSWGFDFDASSGLVEVTNLGSVSDPVAGLTLGLTYEVKNILNTSYHVDRFFLSGNGEIKYLE